MGAVAGGGRCRQRGGLRACCFGARPDSSPAGRRIPSFRASIQASVLLGGVGSAAASKPTAMAASCLTRGWWSAMRAASIACWAGCCPQPRSLAASRRCSAVPEASSAIAAMALPPDSAPSDIARTVSMPPMSASKPMPGWAWPIEAMLLARVLRTGTGMLPGFSAMCRQAGILS